MALELFGGAILGVVFGQLQEEISRVKDNVVTFKPKLEEIEETLDILYPVTEEIDELNRRLNRPNHGRETIVLKRLLEDGTKLVSKCSKIPRWNLRKQSRYREKLMELDNKILRFHSLYMQAHMGRDQKQTLLLVQETRQMLFMSLNQQGSSSNPTFSFTTFSANSSYMMKTVMKVHMDSNKLKLKALKALSAVPGVISVEIGGDDQEKVVVVGDVDPVRLAWRLTKRGLADLISIGTNSGEVCHYKDKCDDR